MVGRARPASWVRSGHGDAALPAFLVRWRPRACELRVPLRQGGCPGPAHLRAAFETGCEGVRNLKYTAPFKASCSAVVFPAGVGKRRQGRSAAGGGGLQLWAGPLTWRAFLCPGPLLARGAAERRLLRHTLQF